MSFITAAANKITHTTLRTAAKWGLSKEAAKTVSRQAIEDLREDGLYGISRQTLMAHLKRNQRRINEGAEEALQEGLGAYAAQALIDENGKFRNWDEVENVKQQVLRRANQ